MIFLEEILGESNYYFFHQKICNVIDSLVMVKIHMGFFFDVSTMNTIREHFVQ